ncbi:MAG: nickel-dependent hydrogenase large subunit [Negativicutes bacterium]|nr:nickel-dependent hydrogenase large subunit [Negativicutes bacterium]
MRRIVIDPVTRLEGHLKVMVEVDAGKVVKAEVAGTLFRGFEKVLVGRDPRDAVFLTQRICGVCPADHATAAALALDEACQVEVPANGRVLRNLMLGGNYLQSHITHFYHLSLPDYVEMPEVVPFTPHYTGDFRLSKEAGEKLAAHYFAALNIRRKCHELVAQFGGKMPHLASIIAGGTSQNAKAERIAAARLLLKDISGFINTVYEDDVRLLASVYKDYFQLGKGSGNLLTYGAFPLDAGGGKKLFARGVYQGGAVSALDPGQITEDVSHSWYTAKSGGRPADFSTQADADKAGAYSWVKAPRYQGGVFEVGPLARMWMNGIYQNGISAMDRIVARMLEAKFMAVAMERWLDELDPAGPCETAVEIPYEAEGVGLTEAARGALGHWVKIRGGRIERYEAVVPTTWNASPVDAAGKPGALEQALVGLEVPDADNPLPVIRVIHSFDPCLACAVHLAIPGQPMAEFKI